MDKTRAARLRAFGQFAPVFVLNAVLLGFFGPSYGAFPTLAKPATPVVTPAPRARPADAPIQDFSGSDCGPIVCGSCGPVLCLDHVKR